MATKTAPFTLKEADLCVKCGASMPIGTNATWLREPERKGMYHPTCEAKPTIQGLTRIKAVDPSAPLGYSWMRQRHIPAMKPVVQPIVSTSSNEALLNLLTDLLMPQITKKIAEVPRIIVQVYVPKAGAEVQALETLSRELFTLGSVRTI